jgi:hypothetical protein
MLNNKVCFRNIPLDLTAAIVYVKFFSGKAVLQFWQSEFAWEESIATTNKEVCIPSLKVFNGT